MSQQSQQTPPSLLEYLQAAGIQVTLNSEDPKSIQVSGSLESLQAAILDIIHTDRTRSSIIVQDYLDVGQILTKEMVQSVVEEICDTEYCFS